MSNNFMKIQMGEGVFEEAVLEIQVGGKGGGGGSKKRGLPSWRCGFFLE